MEPTFTDEALVYWNQLTEEEKTAWTTNTACQNCQSKIDPGDFSGSIYEGQLALFHLCTSCGTKEVRLIDINQQSQQAVDDDFQRWLQSKRQSHPDKFTK
jgi:hypothetical protein